MMELNKEVIDLSVQFQQECHSFTKDMMAQVKDTTVQDGTNVFLFHKLAQFELRLRKLEEGKKRADGYLNLHTPLM